MKGRAQISFSLDYSMISDLDGYKTLWVSRVKSGKPEKVYEFEAQDIRINYPVWSPNGKRALFDCLKPQGGDTLLMENFE